MKKIQEPAFEQTTEEFQEIEIQRVEEAYDADQIEILEGLEAVRKRPGMYIGSSGFQGLHHLVREIVDNSVDEFQAGYGSMIEVTAHTDGSLSVKDYGRGIPTGMHTKHKKPAIEITLTVLHAGGKFKGGKGAYKNSGGLHGVGASVTNALSEWFEATVHQNGKIHQISFATGKKTKDLTVIGTCPIEETGTYIRFMPDEAIFQETTEFDHEWLFEYLREVAMLNSSLSVLFRDERKKTEDNGTFETSFCFEKGLAAYVQLLNKNQKVLHDNVIRMGGQKDDVIVEIAMQYTGSDSKDRIYSFANNIKTPEGGKHEEAFKRTLTSVMNKYITTSKSWKSKNDKMPKGEDVRSGLTAIVSVKVLDPEFEGQTKTKLGNREVTPVINEIVSESLTRYFDEHPHETQVIVQKVIDAFEVRLAVEKARNAEKRKKSTYSSSRTLPAKLEDANTFNPSLNEIYIVEGDSAGGSAKQGRDKATQAVLPTKGKNLNVEKSDLNAVKNNEELENIRIAIGTGILDEYDDSKRRYDKIIIMTDADTDGEHIQVLLSTYFFRYMPKLIEDGRVFLACPPLYKITVGKRSKYVYNEGEKEEYLSTLSASTSFNIQRYKGLGEMNPRQLWETTMNPETRTLFRLTIEDMEQVDQMFKELMGDDVEPRKQFISEYGIHADLDV